LTLLTVLAPGHSYTGTTSGTGRTVQICGDGYYRVGWVVANTANLGTRSVPCIPCASPESLLGVGVKTVSEAALTIFSPSGSTTELVVGGTSDACGAAMYHH